MGRTSAFFIRQKRGAALARMISYMNDDTYMFRWDGRTDIPDHVLDDYADIQGEDDLLVSIHERAKEQKSLEGSDDGSSHSSGSSDDNDSYMTRSKEDNGPLEDSAARHRQIIDSMFKSLESSGLVNDKQATVGFNYLNFDRSSQLQLRAFYCKDRAGDRSDEDSSMVATILSTVLDRLGVSSPSQRKLVVNKFTWRQYKRFELLTTTGSVADAFGVLVEGQCEMLKGPAGPTKMCPEAVAPTLMRRRVLEPELPEPDDTIRALEQFGRNVPTGSHFGLEAVQAKAKYTTHWQDSLVAVGPCDVLCIKKDDLRFVTTAKIPNLQQRLRLLQKFPMFDEEAQHSLHLLAMLLKPEKVQRGQILLKQGEKHQDVLLVNSKTHLRVLRKVTLEGGRQRVVELQPLRGPCLLNERCLSTGNTECTSTILVSNPGTMYTLDRFALFQTISSWGLKQIKSTRSDDVSDKEIADQYMHHASWKRYKEDLVEDVIARSMA